MAYVAKRNADRCPTHPGALLREDVIRRPEGPRPRLRSFSAFPASISMTYCASANRFPAMAVRLGKLFGDGAGVWVRMQAAYDTWHAERKEDVSKIPPSAPRPRSGIVCKRSFSFAIRVTGARSASRRARSSRCCRG